MADTPITFTAEEQLQLQELDKQGQAFSSYRLALTRCLCSGQDSIIMANLIQFIGSLGTQTSNQIEQVKKSAQERNNKSKEQSDAV